MAKVENVGAVRAALKARGDASRKDDDCSVVVGYTQAYAVFVHENLEARHPVGRAKFLEEPARTKRGEMAEIILSARRSGQPLRAALLKAGLFLQRESQLICPVDTGALKGSAFTRVEDVK